MTLNIENMNKLADYIEALPEGAFNQFESNIDNNEGCGCICHYAGILSGNLKRTGDGFAINYTEASRDWMGTTEKQWRGLFKMYLWPEKFTEDIIPTAKTAAARIRHMIETGE